MKEYFYARVSTMEQREDRQLDTAARLKIPAAQIFTDKQSGKNFQRPAWKSLMEQLAPGDLLYVSSLDRVGRNYAEIQEVWRALTKERGVDICVLNMPLLDTRKGRDLMGTFIADVVLQILAFCSENERTNIRERQADGIKAARARGVKFGRPIKKPPKNFGDLVKQWERGNLHLSVILEKTGLSEATFYRRLREHRISRKK
jgi:DNA invertase Pin-like site-specific DNA recombinase